MTILHVLSVRFLEHQLAACRRFSKKLEHVLLRQPEAQSAQALRPQHRFRGGLIRTAIGRIEHVERECADEEREYFHRVTPAHRARAAVDRGLKLAPCPRFDSRAPAHSTSRFAHPCCSRPRGSILAATLVALPSVSLIPRLHSLGCIVLIR